MLIRSVLCLLMLCSVSFLPAADWPAVEKLPEQPEYPPVLKMFAGSTINSVEEWEQQRRPELKELIQYYMYGYFPAAPEEIDFELKPEFSLFEGKARGFEVVITYAIKQGGKKLPPLNLLVILPRNSEKPVPLFLGMNFCGNHTLLPNKEITLTKSWVYDSCGGQDHHAIEGSRGSQFNDWGIDTIIERGYGFAAFHSADIDPDENDFTNGIHPYFYKKGQTSPGPHEWGTIAAWAWGAQRAVDYLVTNPNVNKNQIALIGHSRLGKTALLAAAFDERIALSIPHQAGCGGTAPNRGTVGESVEIINRAFPHWFNNTFPKFSQDVNRIPFDQHSLVALMAPRPVLLSNAVEDTWADPEGQFLMLKEARPAFDLYGGDNLLDEEQPKLGKLSAGRLGYYIREGNHSMTRGDWQVFLNYADTHF
ncbi:MAG: acetylxylan esterase, partial [Planctomycetaceae bacterium]|nr:acetylxylan esterase [Planctomycetaceae bacterium]